CADILSDFWARLCHGTSPPLQRITMDLGPHHWLDLSWLTVFYRLSALWALIKSRLSSKSSQIRPAQAPPVEPACGPAGCPTHGLLYDAPVAVWRLTPVACCRLYLCWLENVCSTPTFAWPPGPRMVRGTYGSNGRDGARPDVLPRTGTPRDPRR